jgi:prolyl 4-hydroxylase
MDYKKLADGIDLYEGIFTEFECNHIIEHAKHIGSDSRVHDADADNKEYFDDPEIVNSTCWLPHNKSSIVARMCEKISYITCSPLENAEKLQVIHYPEDGSYNLHCDSWVHDNSEIQKSIMKYGGQRLLTAIVYLNDVEKGGETTFPNKNIVVKPKIGTILVFNNCIDNTNKMDLNSIHGCMPVIKGKKWTCNLWFREKPVKTIMYQND